MWEMCYSGLQFMWPTIMFSSFVVFQISCQDSCFRPLLYLLLSLFVFSLPTLPSLQTVKGKRRLPWKRTCFELGIWSAILTSSRWLRSNVKRGSGCWEVQTMSSRKTGTKMKETGLRARRWGEDGRKISISTAHHHSNKFNRRTKHAHFTVQMSVNESSNVAKWHD